MATVTGMTAAAMQAIRDNTIVSAAFDSANHLILTKYDGTQVDGGVIGAATTTLPGPVELATSAETQSGTDATRAVTPAGLASIPGYKVQILADNSIAETADTLGYPQGVSLMSLTTSSGWSINAGFGTLVTNRISTGRTSQTFYENSGGTTSVKAWVREYNTAVGGGGWTAWGQMMLAVRLNEANFSQTTALTSYPSGLSYLYYTTANGGSWDFTGMAGTVETTFLVDKAYGTQTFTQHSAGSQNTPNVWIRTSDSTTGWSGWKKLADGGGSWLTYTPTWSTTSGLHLPSPGTTPMLFKASKTGKTVNVTFDITFATGVNFGSGATTVDNWIISLPPAWPANTSPPGTILGLGDMYRDRSNVGFMRIKLTGSQNVSFGILMTFVAGVLTTSSSNGIGGDVDSLSPWTWAVGDVFRGNFTYETTA